MKKWALAIGYCLTCTMIGWGGIFLMIANDINENTRAQIRAQLDSVQTETVAG